MIMKIRKPHVALCALLITSLGWMPRAAASGQAAAPAAPPAVGEAARDFTLSRIDGRPITLSALTKQGPVVVLMLRGWVGYQ